MTRSVDTDHFARTPHQTTLYLGGALELDGQELLLGLHPFGHQPQIEIPCQVDDAGRDRAIDRIVNISDEETVHRQGDDQQLTQVAEGASAGGELIDRNSNPATVHV